MRELDSRRTLSRIRGRPALERRLPALLVAVHRFGRCRARTREEMAWTAKTIDRLTDALSDDVHQEMTP